MAQPGAGLIAIAIAKDGLLRPARTDGRKAGRTGIRRAAAIEVSVQEGAGTMCGTGADYDARLG
ncbi:hypothetical protein CS8_022860 [Cupriavidus sp. 8B]